MEWDAGRDGVGVAVFRKTGEAASTPGPDMTDVAEMWRHTYILGAYYAAMLRMLKAVARCKLVNLSCDSACI